MCLAQFESCDYGYFTSIHDDCMFYCSTTDQYVSPSLLSFEEIRYACENIDTAIRMNDIHCNSINDLIWPTNACDCPQCRCDTLDLSGTPREVNAYGHESDGPSKTCYN